MKTRGRNICDTLKAIRKQIADANGIDYSSEECNYTPIRDKIAISCM